MSQTHTVTNGQSLIDVALQALGSVEGLFDLAAANGLSITDALAPGLVLMVPASTAAQPAVAAYFAGRSQRVNTTNVTPADMPILPNGIFDVTYDEKFN